MIGINTSAKQAASKQAMLGAFRAQQEPRPKPKAKKLSRTRQPAETLRGILEGMLAALETK